MTKKIVKKVDNEAPIVESKNEVIVDEVIDNEVSKPKESTIFDKYRNHLETAKEGYLRNIQYAEAVEILRYVQDKTGHKLGLSMSCSSCLLSLVKTFANLEK